MCCTSSAPEMPGQGGQTPFDDEQRAIWTQRMVETAEYLNRQFYLGRVDIFGGIDLTVGQAKALVILQRQGPLRMGQLSVGLGRAFSATTSIVVRLMEKGMLVRHPDPSDRRCVVCEITQAGAAALSESWAIGAERIQRITDIMTDEELHDAVKGLDAIREAEMRIQKIIGDLANDVGVNKE